MLVPFFLFRKEECTMKPEDLSDYDKKNDLENKKFIYLLLSEDLQTAVAFEGSEQEMLDL